MRGLSLFAVFYNPLDVWEQDSNRWNGCPGLSEQSHILIPLLVLLPRAWRDYGREETRSQVMAAWLLMETAVSELGDLQMRRRYVRWICYA